MTFTCKLSPELWAVARRLCADGVSYAEIARRLGMVASTVGRRAREEGWPTPAGDATKRTRAKPRLGSPATAGIRGRLAQRLYRVIECKIKMMELRMTKQLQAHMQADERAADGS